MKKTQLIIIVFIATFVVFLVLLPVILESKKMEQQTLKEKEYFKTIQPMSVEEIVEIGKKCTSAGLKTEIDYVYSNVFANKGERKAVSAQCVSLYN